MTQSTLEFPPLNQTVNPLQFAERIATWQERHGRHQLPWQNNDPYCVWLSEIMLQQTQVATVLNYYPPFLARFPDIFTLAAAPPDEILAYWSGLGYYSRARNLQHAAQQIMNEYGGRFPINRTGLETLCGVGRSTAAAIAVFAYGQKEAILDGNVKRILTRHAGIYGALDRPATQKLLWAEAEARLPDDTTILRRYTQGLMDLGAAICTRGHPHCGECPVASDCYALAHNATTTLPEKRSKKAKPEKATVMLLATCNDTLHLYRRPDSGIWRSLWSLPEYTDMDAALRAARQLGNITLQRILPALIHHFTHYTLHITPLAVSIGQPTDPADWLPRIDVLNKGLPAPVRHLITTLPMLS